ncbi:unnamed protein product [Clonostachys rosea f. rosea IK726]|uniref:Uncharacterized protein n=1 Tax=Clonostachys rosea f. rosea IK726 TaxID=1349383 RepID=A0ACA9TXH1_BIOOC|nr:unnamed protein product [Clonostachys rosea f. rosea IK726]
MPELTIIIGLSETPPTSHLGFGFFARESRARLYPERDIRCENWQDFNVGRNRTTEETKNRIRGFDDKSTDYCKSLATSPLRIWSLADKRGIKTQGILIIDLQDLGFCGTGMTKTKYGAKHRVAATGWNPAHSMADFLP